MTDTLSATTLRCSVCASPTSLQVDSSPFSRDDDQWYECGDGHVSRKLLRPEARRAR